MRLQLMQRLSQWKKLRHVLGIWLVVMLTVGAPWADAAVYYVNATTGSNGDDGMSSVNAWETITYALSQATSGDTINVAAGLYDTPSNGESFPLELVNGVALIGAGAGSVTSLSLTTGGSGYDTAPDVSFTGGGGTGAEAFAVIDGGVVTELVLTGGGGGYTSNPTVVFTGGTPDVAATATATAGPGVSTISAPEGGQVFFNDEALSAATRLSGFLLKHDASVVNDNILEFAVGNFAMAPRIDSNAFVDYESAPSGDTGIYFYDNSASDGSFTPTIENNTMSGLYVGTWMDDSGAAVGGSGDNFSPTIQNNSFTSVDYAMDFTFSSSQGGDVQPQVLGNTTWNAINDVYIDVSLGSDFDNFSLTLDNNTFREATSDSIYSTVDIYSGSHTFSPTYTNNTITAPGGNGFSMLLSINSSDAQDQTVTPVISGNTISDAGDIGIYLSMDTVFIEPGFTAEVSPTINSNTITDASGSGISVTFSSASEGNFVSNMTISGNRIERVGAQGIYVELSEFYDTDLDDVTTNWLIANNTINDSVEEGISLTISSLTGVGVGDTGLMNNTITGNNIDGSGDSGLWIYFSPGTESTVEGNFMVEGNTITDGDIEGIRLSFSSGADADQTLIVRGNTITGNGEHGISVSLSTQSEINTNTLLVQDNVIANNTDYGVYVAAIEDSPDPMIFSCNTITGNGDGGVYIAASSVTLDGGGIAVNFGDSTVASPGYNVIMDNSGGTFDFYNDNALPIKAENNYWGTTDPSTIDSHISDDNEATGGLVDFTPSLDSAAEIERSITADAAFSGVEDDADSSGGPSVGDTLRFCTTVTGGGNCGSGTTVTLTIPIPANTTLVPGSVTTDHGAVDLNATDIVVTGIVLEPGEVANVCFDVVANSGTAVTVDVSADGDQVAESQDSVTVSLAAAAALPVAIPTAGEWGLILMSCLLMLIGLFTIRRGGLAVLLAAALALFTAAGADAAKPQAQAKNAGSKEKVKHQSVTIQSVTVKEGNVTIDFADGTSLTVAENDLEIKDNRDSASDKRSAHATAKKAKSAGRAVRSDGEDRPQKIGTKQERKGRLDAAGLAALLASPSAKSSDGQSAILKVKDNGNGKEMRLKLTLYESLSQAQSAVTAREKPASPEPRSSTQKKTN